MSEYNIQMNKYNALNANYDQLYPQPMKHASTHAKDGSDPILPSSIGAYSKEETDTLLANNDPRQWGLGSVATYLTEADDLNTIGKGGWYWWTSSVPKNASGLVGCTMRVDPGETETGSYSTQTIYFIGQNKGAKLRRYNAYDAYDTWTPWEWENPPMLLGDEYRTTERYLAKPVYVKVVDCGNMPNNSKKIVCANIGPNVVDKYVYFSAENYLSQYDMTVLPANELGTYYANARIAMGRKTSSELYEPYIELFGSNAWASAYTCRATIKYTKIAD